MSDERVAVAMTFTRLSDGTWMGSCAGLPEAFAGGDSLPDCRRRLRDAVESVLLYAPRDDVEDLMDFQPVRVVAEIAEVRFPERPARDLVTQADIARIAGISRQAVSRWARDVRGFPRPFSGKGRGALWERDEVLRWLGAGRRRSGRPGVRDRVG